MRELPRETDGRREREGEMGRERQRESESDDIYSISSNSFVATW